MTPPDRETLLGLAARVEAASGPDRRLDYEIMTATVRPGRGYLWDPADSNHRYSSSLDAAVSLVPEGAFWAITMRGEKRGGFHACCQLEGSMDWREAATPALALCAAALRALAQQVGV